MDRCVMIIRDAENNQPTLLKLFVMEAFHNILCARAGRLDYLDTSVVPEQGELRDAAVERFLEHRLTLFNRYEILFSFC